MMISMIRPGAELDSSKYGTMSSRQENLVDHMARGRNVNWVKVKNIMLILSIPTHYQIP